MKLQITYQSNSLGTEMVYYLKKDDSCVSVHNTKEDAEKAFHTTLNFLKEVSKAPVIIKEIEL